MHGLMAPACSLVAGWSGEQTVQYEGTAREATGRTLFCEEIALLEILSWLKVESFLLLTLSVDRNAVIL